MLSRAPESEWWFELDAEGSPFASDAVRWHWPIDLVDLCAAILRPSSPPAPSSFFSASASSPSSAPSSLPQAPGVFSTTSPENTPLRLILHLSGAPGDKLVIPSSAESVKTHFTSQVKEADFVRWGNTKRVTGMRRADLEAGWDGVVAGDYDLHARMAQKVVPLPIPLSPSPTPSGIHSPPPGAEADKKPESAYAARSLPIKMYLPDGAPAIQIPVQPLTDGRPTTVVDMLRSALPLLFPPGGEAYALAQPLAQGILLPPDADVAWLAACMAGADGWLRIGIRFVAE